jgi:bisphosphoglycerate-dependent phosphoglycerate mutase
LLRHGQSEWNARSLFTGWVNVPLTEAGSEKRTGRTAAGCVLERVAAWEIPTSVPLAYVLGADMSPVGTGGRYLGPGRRR